MPHPSQTIHRHIPSLDGLRGLAFLLVFTFHYAVSRQIGGMLAHTSLFLATGGWMGVDLFFVLSGFLITGILIDTRDTPHYYRNFYIRRALRIFPLFYGVLFLLLALTPLLHLQWVPGHLWLFLYLGNVAGHVDPALNEIQPAAHLTHFWSLAVEEQFYFLWPLVLFHVRRRRSMLAVCAALMAASFLLRGLLVWRFHAPAFEWSYGELPTHADGLLTGAICAVLYRKYDIRTLLRWSRPFLLTSAAALAAIFWESRSLNYHTAVFTLFGYPALATFCACLLLRVAAPGTLPARFGASRLLRFFGKYSYGMYVYHQVLVPLVSPWLRTCQRLTGSIALGGMLYFVTVLAGTSLAAVLSFQLYERQWLRLKSRFDYPDRADAPKPSIPSSPREHAIT